MFMKMRQLLLILALATQGWAQVISGQGGLVFNGGISGNSQGTISTPVAITAPTCAPLPNGTALTPYSVTFSASGGTGPYSFAVVSGTAPNGIGFTGANFAGTPTTSNTYSFGVKASDALGASSPTLSCQVTIQPSGIPPVTITTTPTLRPAGQVGVPLTDSFSASGGTPPYSWSVPAGTIPGGAEDVLTYASMKLPDRLTKHLSGDSVKYFHLDNGLLEWIKGSSGSPMDGEAFDGQKIKQWITEGNTFSNPSGYKKYRTPVDLWPRYHVAGADDVTYTPGPNLYDITESCGSDNLTPIDNLGVRGELTGPFTDITWQTTYGGDIPDNTPYLLGQKWIKCTANDITKCTNEEDYWMPLNYGQARWCPKTWNGSTYVTGTCSTNTHVVAGGAPTLNFACRVPNLTAAGNLPPGTPVATGTSMTMASDTGVTSGTPNTAGTYNYTVQVEDSTGSIAQKTFQTVINPAGTCGPPTYQCSRTDFANSAPFLPVPNVGGLTGFNTIVTPSGFNGNRIVRVTDTQWLGATHNTSFWNTCGGTAEDINWNANSTLFALQDEGCNSYVAGFNPSTFQASKLYPALLPTTGFRLSSTFLGFKYGSNTILHVVNGVTIQDYDFTDWVSGPKTTPPTPTTVVDFTAASNGAHNCLPAGFVSLSTSVGGSTAADNIALAVSTTSGQGSTGMTFIVVHSPTKGCAMWNTVTGAVTADVGWGAGAGMTCNASSCTGTITTPPDHFTIHNIKVGLNDSWVVVTGTTCLNANCLPNFPNTSLYFWNIGTTTVGWTGQGGFTTGHGAVGNLKYFNNPGSNHLFQDAIRNLGFNSPASLIIPLTSFPTFPSTGLGVVDTHYSWNNVDALDTYPVSWTVTARSSGGVANNWVQVNTPAGATQIRDFEINRRTGCFYLADRLSGFWTSCDKGTNWSQRNTGTVTTTGWTVTYDAPRDQVIYGTYSVSGSTTAFYRTSDDGQHWTPITLPSTSTTGWPTYTGGTFAPDGSLLVGFTHGNAGSGGTAYSSNGTSFTQSVVPANATCTAPGGAWGLFHDTINKNVWLGSEQCGVFRSSDNGHNFQVCSPPDNAFAGGIRIGNAEGFAVDSAGATYMASQGGLWKAPAGSCPLTWTNIFGNSNTSEGRSVYIDSRGSIYYGHKKDTAAPNPPANGGTTPVYQSTDGGATWAAFSTGLPTQQEAWRFIENPFDHQLYAYLQVPSTDAGSVWVTVPANGTLAPYAWQNEILATSPIVNNGTTWRFAPSFNSAISHLFQTQISSGTISQDGKFLLFNSDWEGQLGSETGGAGCMLGVNCRGDVFVVELK
jgi:hypothetical protein